MKSITSRIIEAGPIGYPAVLQEALMEMSAKINGILHETDRGLSHSGCSSIPGQPSYPGPHGRVRQESL